MRRKKRSDTRSEQGSTSFAAGPATGPGASAVRAGVSGEVASGVTAGRYWPAFLCVVGLAALLRVAYTLASRQSPFFDHLDLDSRFYDLWAKQIAGGDWIGKEVFFMGPLYPYFLAVVYRLAGPSLLLVKLIQAGLGALTAGFTYLLGRECFGSVAGLVAGFLAALYIPFIFYDSSILFPVLATLLNTAMLYTLYRGLRRADARWFLVAGVLAGLSAAGNASVLIFGPFLVVFLLAFSGGDAGHRIRRAGLFIIGVAVIVTPIAVRNAAVGDDFVPLTSNAGLNLYIGNNERATGAYVKPEGLDVYTDPEGESIAEAALGRQLKPSEVSRYWTGRALEFARNNRGRFASNLARKLFLFWSVYEVPQIEHLPFEKRYSWLLRLPSPSYGIVCPLGLVGMLLALRRKREAWPLALFVLAYSTTIVAFFVVARYRLPMVPALMVFAAYAALWMVSAAVRRTYRPLAWSVIGFAALFAFFHANFYRINPLSGFAQSYYRLGIIQEKKGRPAEAVTSYRKALDLDPSLAPGHLNLGILLSREGRYEEAKSELALAVGLDSTYSKAYYNLGLVYAEQAKHDSALLMVDRALQLQEDYGLARLAKAGIFYETARFDLAETLLAELRSDPSLGLQAGRQIDGLLGVIPARRAWMSGRLQESQRLSDSYLLRGDNLLSLGLEDRALRAYLRAVGADSLSGVAMFQAGSVYFNRGMLGDADRYFGAALRVMPGLKGAHFARGVIALRGGDMETACGQFERELEVDPVSSRSHINLAMCYEEHFKDLARAADHLAKYIEITGGTDELRNHLKELEAQTR
jgi:tetratricopeptide (TPR) repeat protein